ncbi:MAG: ABC transporter substrate-binding protein [Spirochaetaceae bacterium]|jgi:peptide/nickel transport system substrate-binding protein|nr:ABC transporter substrate-binding protein [Spirochaetaceae bacterium]
MFIYLRSILTARCIFALAAALGMSLSFGSCAKKSAGTGAPDQLILAVGGEPDEGFDPCTGWGRYGSPLFQSTLLEFDKDMNFSYDLAEDYSVSANGLVWTFRIRRDAKFTDGTNVNARDVAFTYNTAKQTDSEVDLTRMKEARAVNDTTVEFVLNTPMSAFPYIAVTLGIVPENIYTQNPQAYGQKPVGSGPYKFVQWDKGQQLIVERNDDYYGQMPAFKRLVLLFYDTDAALASVLSGEADIAMTVPALVRDIPGYTLLRCLSVDNRGVSFPATKSGTKNADGLPVGNDVTSDIAIRKALIYGIDRDAIVNDALRGYGRRADSACDNLPWWNPQTRISDKDADGQKKALDAAGWIEGSGGIREKNGLRASFELMYPANDSLRQAIALEFARQARALGIEVKPLGGSWDDIGRRMYETPVEFGWGAHNPMEIYNLYYGKYATDGYNNLTNMVNPAVDRYMDAALAALSYEEAIKNWRLAQWDGVTGFSSLGDATWCWLVDIDHLYYVRSNLDTGNQRIHPHGHGFPIISNIKEWKRK